VEFDLEVYRCRTAKLDTEDIDFSEFRRHPLHPDALRCLRYMHDVECHTVCYLRDLLVTRAHKDPDVTTFLTFWNFEEYWHGATIDRVLEVHGQKIGRDGIATFRQRLPRRDALRPIVSQLASIVLPQLTAVQMTWGAVNEWTTQAGYARLVDRTGHPVLADLLRRIMRQEGRHIDFYASEADRRLAGDRSAQHLTRRLLAWFWRPVGSGIMPEREVTFVRNYLFGGPEGAAMAARIDRRVDRFPGLGGLRLLERKVANLA
jgi:hypothetical protein